MKQLDIKTFWWVLAVPSIILVFLLLHFSRLPGELRPEIVRYFTPEEILSGRAYNQLRYFLFGIENLLGMGFLALLAFTASGGVMATWTERLANGRYYLSLGFLAASIVVTLSLLLVPLEFYRGFYLEHLYGLSNETVVTWFSDWAKTLVIKVILAVLPVTVLFWIVRTWTSNWWLVAGTAFTVWTIVLTMAQPLAIDPVFHSFEPIKDPAIIEKTTSLMNRADLQAGEILVMDASRRTNRVNAYFTGFGATKRIVLYDNLLRNYTPEGVEVVLAHEIGHWKGNHINKGILLASIGGFVFFYLVHVVLRSMANAGMASFRVLWDIRAFPVILLLGFFVSFLALPFQNYVSRNFEREADAMALQLTGNPEEVIRLEKRLATDNLSDLRPHPFVRWMLYSHPPIAERIAVAEGYRAARPAGP